jgi:hypothetical protein
MKFNAILLCKLLLCKSTNYFAINIRKIKKSEKKQKNSRAGAVSLNLGTAFL